MKIAVTTSGDNLAAPLDSRFGRAARILVYDTVTKGFQMIDNTQNLNAAQGAGIQAAQTVANAGANALITGHCGPKAFRVLHAAGIKVYNCEAATVGDALNQLEDGKLQIASGADVEGHWL
ncbi:MAG: NifB/NifX family molybdenum-iron cluster-binding protein [Deltaproteobacteria bacterium]|jgi:predicted Fe-Mo cluster-binding NifX family protein|nr:NifB/NifX family molybdenum-iron cluster-binding protein [Deltaproteobacteria bacterium]